ncbi:M20/M25/M40 family metallo-hydrolase [Aquimarina sp. ERC-38]|uniref:M20/M25/M40 family metallo-hydrolase n=1 Tax=Aquimarina sp. ERC-38 TaxID=2949996 RepID=UPI002246E024|nr:M20/M25/M40 family metallo-hydrolase [Aquimarina sp. ERC-38]UZO80903.1 M20/M25/M40 family metallo-hydrolase [Aquimarina sp. ERC-38]
MRNKGKLLLSLMLLYTLLGTAQNKDSVQLKKIYTTSLLNGKSYEWLEYLSNQIGPRLSGSVKAEEAVEWTKEELGKLGLDKVWLQPVMVPKWTRGVPEFAFIETKPGKTTKVDICALGGSVATAPGGTKARVIEVKSLEELKEIPKDSIKGRIVFYNRPMQADLINTFEAYGGCVDQRYSGALEAVKYGAVGVLVRSMNLRKDDLPHTGSMSYGDLKNYQKIPAAAISTNGADLLSSILSLNPNVQFSMNMNCRSWPDVQSYNVIGEIKGTTYPDQYMVVGGHLDSWDLGDGSHDDGAGVVQSMEVLRLLKESGYQPKHSLRVVLFMNEENGLRGGKEYAKVANEKKENHVFALESDAGGFTPRGFSLDCDDTNFTEVTSWKPLFEPYLIHQFTKGYSGADINPLKKEGIVLAGLRPDSQRYFVHHHAKNDTFEAINKRELELGAATMASLVYLMDSYLQ